MDRISYEMGFRNIKEYFAHMDPAFFEQYTQITQEIIANVIPNYIEKDLSGDELEELFASFINETEKLDYNSAIAIATDFFNSINPQLGLMFQNIIHEHNFSFKVDENNEIGSNEDNIMLSGTYYDVVQIVHEFVHKFSSTPKNPSLTSTLIEETNSIAYELKAVEFLKQKYNVQVDMNKIRLLSIIDHDQPGSFVDSYLTFLKLLKEGKLDFDNYLEYFRSLPLPQQQELMKNEPSKIGNSGYASMFVYYYTHELGYILACYLLKENNLQALDAIAGCLSSEKELEPEVIAYLEKLGVPIFKDGKVSLEGENYEKMLNAVPEYLASVENRSEGSR